VRDGCGTGGCGSRPVEREDEEEEEVVCVEKRRLFHL